MCCVASLLLQIIFSALLMLPLSFQSLLLQRNCRSSENPNEVFRFLVEEKLKCLATEKVKYTQRVDYIMQLPVPMDAALNKGQ